MTDDAEARLDLGQYYQKLASTPLPPDQQLPNQRAIAGDYDDALKDLNAAVKDVPNNPEAFFWLGSAYLYRVYPNPDRGQAIADLTLAINDFWKAIDLRNPEYPKSDKGEDPNAFKELAKAYNRLGKLKVGESTDFESAKEAANEALKLAKRPENFDTSAQANALNQLAIADESLGNDTAALDDLKQALALSDNYAQAIATRGSVSYNMGQYVEAERDFNTAIFLSRYSTDLPEAYFLRAKLKDKRGDSGGAAADRKMAWGLGYVPPPPAK